MSWQRHEQPVWSWHLYDVPHPMVAGARGELFFRITRDTIGQGYHLDQIIKGRGECTVDVVEHLSWRPKLADSKKDAREHARERWGY